MKDIEKTKLSFSEYAKEHSKYGSLREMFYKYIIARNGRLPQSNEECRDEIEDAIAIFFEEKNEKSSTKVQIKPEDFYLSLTVEDNKVLDFDIVIEHTDKSKMVEEKMNKGDTLQNKATQTLTEKFSKMEEDAILELLDVAQVPLSKDGTLVDAMIEKDFKIYGLESRVSEPNVLKSTWVLEHCNKIVAQRDVLLTLKISDKVAEGGAEEK